MSFLAREKSLFVSLKLLTIPSSSTHIFGFRNYLKKYINIKINIED